jgi:hypothetical protein
MEEEGREGRRTYLTVTGSRPHEDHAVVQIRQSSRTRRLSQHFHMERFHLTAVVVEGEEEELPQGVTEEEAGPGGEERE